MNAYQVAWLAIGVVGGVTELVALFNRRTNDTLSEQFWLMLKVFPDPVCSVDGNRIPCPQHTDTHAVVPPQSRRLPSGAIRARRFAFIAIFGWLTIHFATGWA